MSQPIGNIHALPQGYMLHWYRIEHMLGQGGFGITYLAQDTNLNQKVAIKEFLPTGLAGRGEGSTVQPISPDHAQDFKWGLSRFIKEGQTLARFKHRNIVAVNAVFEGNETAYIVMEYIEGEAFHLAVKRRRLKSEEDLTRIMFDIMGGVEQIHDAGFIHRDIKPENILIRKDGSPVLLDFGSARQAVGAMTQAMTALVSPGYAPYEQYDSTRDVDKQGPWTDIYALGATFYRAVAGKGPPDAMARMHDYLDGTDSMAPATEVGRGWYSEAFLNAIDRALAFKPTDRPQSIREWRALFPADEDQLSAKDAAEQGVSRPAVDFEATDVWPMPPQMDAGPKKAAPATPSPEPVDFEATDVWPSPPQIEDVKVDLKPATPRPADVDVDATEGSAIPPPEDPARAEAEEATPGAEAVDFDLTELRSPPTPEDRAPPEPDEAAPGVDFDLTELRSAPLPEDPAPPEPEAADPSLKTVDFDLTALMEAPPLQEARETPPEPPAADEGRAKPETPSIEQYDETLTFSEPPPKDKRRAAEHAAASIGQYDETLTFSEPPAGEDDERTDFPIKAPPAGDPSEWAAAPAARVPSDTSSDELATEVFEPPAEAPVLKRPAGEGTPTKGRRWLWPAVAAGAVLVLIGAGSWMVLQRAHEDSGDLAATTADGQLDSTGIGTGDGEESGGGDASGQGSDTENLATWMKELDSLGSDTGTTDGETSSSVEGEHGEQVAAVEDDEAQAWRKDATQDLMQKLSQAVETVEERAARIDEAEQARKEREVEAEQLAGERQQKVDDLLSLAAADFDQLNLTSPADDNAYAKYQAVLELEPDNALAQKGVGNIVTKYIELAADAREEKQWERARGFLASAASIMPGSSVLEAANAALEEALREDSEAKRLQKEAEEAAARAAQRCAPRLLEPSHASFPEVADAFYAHRAFKHAAAPKVSWARYEQVSTINDRATEKWLSTYELEAVDGIAAQMSKRHDHTFDNGAGTATFEESARGEHVQTLGGLITPVDDLIAERDTTLVKDGEKQTTHSITKTKTITTRIYDINGFLFPLEAGNTFSYKDDVVVETDQGDAKQIPHEGKPHLYHVVGSIPGSEIDSRLECEVWVIDYSSERDTYINTGKLYFSQELGVIVKQEGKSLSTLSNGRTIARHYERKLLDFERL